MLTTRTTHDRIATTALILALAACTSPRGNTAPADPAGAEDPVRLVVLLVVDQYPSWTFGRDVALFDGGIARLMREGVYYERAAIPYAATFTAPGHAALATGAPPRDTRIVANSWFDPGAGQSVPATLDAESPVFTLGERDATRESPPGVSGRRLAVDGLADVLRRTSAGKARSVSISLKDRSAVFAAGRRPDLAVWYDASQVAMTSSAYYADQAPSWLEELARDHPIGPRLDLVWTPLPDIDHAAITGIPDASPGEHLVPGLGGEFPMELARTEDPAAALEATPLGDELVFETGRAALVAEGLGADEVPDLLCLSFSAPDLAGHVWGQESWERLDIALRLDDALAHFLDFLDQRVGRGRYAVILTSDHGATPLVEHSLAAGQKAGRVTPTAVGAAVERAVADVLGQPPERWVARVIPPTVYMAPAFMALEPDAQGPALDAAVRALAAIEGIGYAGRVDRMAGDCRARSGLDALVCDSIAPGLSGQIYVASTDNYLFTRWPHGTGHGSYTRADRVVPVLVSAPGWPAARVIASEISWLQVAPTAATLLRIPALPAARVPALTPPPGASP